MCWYYFSYIMTYSPLSPHLCTQIAIKLFWVTVGFWVEQLLAELPSGSGRKPSSKGMAQDTSAKQTIKEKWLRSPAFSVFIIQLLWSRISLSSEQSHIALCHFPLTKSMVLAVYLESVIHVFFFRNVSQIHFFFLITHTEFLSTILINTHLEPLQRHPWCLPVF